MLRVGFGGVPLGLDILEEVADLDAQRLGDLVQPAGRDAVEAGLVLVRLLAGHADQLGRLLQGEAEFGPEAENEARPARASRSRPMPATKAG